MSKDTLFQTREQGGDFQFTDRVAEVFDDMLTRSIPNYEQVIAMTAQLLKKFLNQDDRVYDLGCSTGNTLLGLARKLEPLQLRFTGIDNSPAMLKKAALKAEMYSKKDRITFVEGDITSMDIKEAGAVILNYTLQFVRPLLRPGFVQTVYNALRPGGLLILSEKVISLDPALNRAFLDLYFDFKRTQGYSEIEIAKKREALENVLVPFSAEENKKLLTRAGFRSIEPFFQWFNFVSLVAVK